jgi:hypothetical protein
MQVDIPVALQILGTTSEQLSAWTQRFWHQPIMSRRSGACVVCVAVSQPALTGRGYKCSFSPSTDLCESNCVFILHYTAYFRTVRNSSCPRILVKMIGIRTRLPFGPYT